MPILRACAPAAFAALFALASASRIHAANLSREYWSNITGSLVSNLTSNSNYPNKPSGTSVLTMLEGPVNAGDNYGARVRGYVLPPSTGNYVFWISADDQAQLYLSTTDQPANKTLIAQVTSATGYHQWTKSSSQQSKVIALTQGKRYYFEVLHKESTGSDNFSVGWKLPSGTLERPIPNGRLQPFETVSISSTVTQITEGSSAKSAFILTRTGDLNKSLSLSLATSGAALYGPDYLLADLSVTAGTLKSKLFAGDADALAIANGQMSVAIPATQSGTLEEYQAIDGNWRIKWKIARAYLLLGYERKAFPFGKTIGAAEMLNLDAKAFAAEKTLYRQSARFGDFHLISGPDFWNNLSQEFIGGNLATLLDLFNVGSVKYQAVNNNCALANYVPHMCGQLADFGTVTGQSCMSVGPEEMLPANQLDIQSPDLFGYNNRRDRIPANDLPVYALSFSSVLWLTLVHEFTHDLDKRWENDAQNNMALDRKSYCSTNLMDFQLSGTPFVFTGMPGTQNPKDYVSGYAAGLTNAGQDYRDFEDVAESVTAYVLLPEYFRYHAGFSAALKARYDYIKNNIFKGKEFSNLNLISMTSFPWLPATTGNVDLLGPERFVPGDIVVKGSAARKFSAIFPAGKSQVRIEFLPLDETLVEPAEKATLSIAGSTAFQTVSPANASITINNDD
jgi:hypothetical protein